MHICGCLCHHSCRAEVRLSNVLKLLITLISFFSNTLVIQSVNMEKLRLLKIVLLHFVH